ncbi:LysR family transcriptional regulator [Sphingomonas morindae]|uniref:LysR family transcriptional regulator n=1 Tax=Sphingomonas morindae TaxID=1541170 RepID=A0ABY4X3V9_9SPHN|nr:LysR family transcriptional regulator [Sphingomonas morindae]USI71564.1 LysR family transcriptional regulator [Sphingomonas morindae]
MDYPDLNLLIALDALLQEESVVGAARRMDLSPPAMSRTLGRIRGVFGDPILVPAGRKMVPTPRAQELRDPIHSLVSQALGIMQPAGERAIRTLRRSFTIRANDSFIVAFGARLARHLRDTAPGVSVRFAPEVGDDDDALREGHVDLFIGATETLDAEVRVQALIKTAIVCVAREDHAIFANEITPHAFAAYEQIVVSRRGRLSGPIDAALVHQDLRRKVALVAPTFSTALLLLAGSDLILPLPDLYLLGTPHLPVGMRAFPIPLDLPPVTLRQAWHPRFETDTAHRWLREMIRDMCLVESSP